MQAWINFLIPAVRLVFFLLGMFASVVVGAGTLVLTLYYYGHHGSLAVAGCYLTASAEMLMVMYVFDKATD